MLDRRRGLGPVPDYATLIPLTDADRRKQSGWRLGIAVSFGEKFANALQGSTTSKRNNSLDTAGAPMKISTKDEAQMARIALQLLTMSSKPVKSTGKIGKAFSNISATASANETTTQRPKRARDRQVSDKQFSDK
jgi:hypothetical protein